MSDVTTPDIELDEEIDVVPTDELLADGDGPEDEDDEDLEEEVDDEDGDLDEAAE